MLLKAHTEAALDFRLSSITFTSAKKPINSPFFLFFLLINHVDSTCALLLVIVLLRNSLAQTPGS